MRPLWYLALLAGLLPLRGGEGPGCTAFQLIHDDTVLVGKNLDWPIGDGYLLLNVRGESRRGWRPGDAPPLRWTTRYGSITFNQFGRGFPLGGMNEAGLVIEELSYSPSRYPEGTAPPRISELQWIQYQLDTAPSVAAVIASLDSLSITPLLFRLHYFLADAGGRVAVLAFLDGQPRVFVDSTLPVPVLTNNSYPNALRYLAKHRGFGGERIAGDGPESPERFVRAATALRHDRGTHGGTGTARTAAILKSVRQQDTQWSIVYNLTAGTIRFTHRGDSATAVLSVATLTRSTVSRTRFISIDAAEGPLAPEAFQSWTPEANRCLLETVFAALVANGEVHEEVAGSLIDILDGHAR